MRWLIEGVIQSGVQYYIVWRARDDSMFLLCKDKAKLTGSVLLQTQAGQVWLGMLAVSPLLQGSGVAFTQETSAANKAVMTVIACRHELLAFYERREYPGFRKLHPG